MPTSVFATTNNIHELIADTELWELLGSDNYRMQTPLFLATFTLQVIASCSCIVIENI
jgi:hypothetical protein